MIMASSLISNSLHISFDSVPDMDDAGLVAVFESFLAIGLKGFLGFPAVYYEDALTEFFENGLVKDGIIGLSMQSLTNEFFFMTAITCGVKINWSSLLLNILKDMVTPGSRQAKGYAIQICVLLKNVPGFELGESRAFTSSRILTEKTVHRYVVINEKVGGEEVDNAPRVKKTPVKRAASKNRPATDADAERVLILDQHPQSPSTTADSSMHFVEDDIQLEDDSALDHFISTSSATAGGSNDNNALSLALKAVRNQNVIISIDLEATRKEVRDIKAALSKDFDDKLADIRNELLEFRVETQGQLASLSTHLAELIAFLTKCSDDKKGVGSSSRPQPPPENQIRPSGGNGGSGNRAEEQSRYRGGSQRRGDKSGYSKRRYSSSGGGPFRRLFEDWLG
ncbi:21 kDa protein [Dorcoceras hygrometricum]|uniref:21 kDa protein n=1 Tax=Dorcoceras hygrometricum TaxID=472368 RepID=A0A2Z7AW07_9LAMI|nr:21 kDa protein [Dorcoceras hygrometricum]